MHNTHLGEVVEACGEHVEPRQEGVIILSGSPAVRQDFFLVCFTELCLKGQPYMRVCGL